MPDKPLDVERLKELIVDPSAPRGEGEAVHEIAPARKKLSVEELAAAAVAEIEAERGPRRKYSTAERPVLVIDRKRGSYVFLALALGIAAFVWFRVLHRPPPVASDPVELVAVLSPAAAASPAIAPEWSLVRGVSDSLSERGRAMRVGALLVEFERSWVRGDSSAQPIADAIAALLADQPDGSEAAALFGSGSDNARSPDARRALAPLVRAAPMGIGGWLQAARVAAAMGDAGFFASVKSRKTRAALLAMPGVTPEVQAARDRLDELLRRRGRPPFAVVADALELLQRELAN